MPQYVKAIHTILEEVEAQDTPAKKKNLLKEHANNKVLLEILKHAFDPNIKFLIPSGVKYREADALPELLYGRLYGETRRLYVFTTEGLNMTEKRRIGLWKDMLESVDPEDAKILDMLPQKKLPYPGITAKTVKSAFPDLF